MSKRARSHKDREAESEKGRRTESRMVKDHPLVVTYRPGRERQHESERVTECVCVCVWNVFDKLSKCRNTPQFL